MPTPSEVSRQLSGAVATTYTVNPDAEPHEWITVVLTCFAGQGPHKPTADTWAVRKLSYCLNADDEWEIEPLPSSRDAAFFARTSWPLQEALERGQEIAERGALWRRDAR